MNTNRASLLVGLLAGIATALLSLSADTPSSLSFFLLSAATLPILIAGMGWRNTSAIVAAATASIIIALMVSPMVAVMFLATSLGPAAWIAHLANLARPAEEVGGPSGALAWYPLSGILLHLSALVTAGLVILGLIVGYGADIVGKVVDAFLKVMEEQNPSYHPSAEAVSEMKVIFAHALPAVQGAVWVIILFTSFYLAARIVRMSGRANRPQDDVPATLRMPRAGLAAFVAGLVLTLFDGTPAFIGSAICGAFGAGFMLSGFAVMHQRTRGKSWRFAALWFGYVAVIVFTIPLVFFFFAGLLETAGAFSPRRSGPHDKT